MLTLKLKIKDAEVEMTMDELKALYEDLDVIFGKDRSKPYSPTLPVCPGVYGPVMPRMPWESPVTYGDKSELICTAGTPAGMGGSAP